MLFPSDDEIMRRKDDWEKLFEKYSNCADENDEGYDMDDLIAIAEAEDEGREEFDQMEYDENLIDNKVEAYEDHEEDDRDRNLQLQIVQNMGKSREQQCAALTSYFGAEFIQKMQNLFEQRLKEVEKLKLPHWNV